MNLKEEQKNVKFAMKSAVGGGLSRCGDAQTESVCTEA